MLKQDRNALFRLIEEQGLNPADFTAEVDIDQEDEFDVPKEFRITFTPVNLEFIVYSTAMSGNLFSVGWSQYTGTERRVWTAPRAHNACDRTKMLSYFTEWLEAHVQEALDDSAEPDLWEQARLGQVLNPVNDDRNADFTEAEREQIKIGVQNFFGMIEETFQPEPDDSTEIRETLEYLIDAAERVSRFDWKGIAVSTLLTIIIQLNLDTEKGRELWHLFAQAMSVVTHLLQ